MKKFLPLAAVVLAGCASIHPGGPDDDIDREDGREISQLVVPDKVLAAARARVAGFVLTDADLVERNGITVYRLEGTAGGDDCEVDVTPGGSVLRIDR